MSMVSDPFFSKDAVQVLAHHGKSFHWAGRFLPKNVFSAAAIVYAYCRRLDDHIDENPATTISEKKQWLENEQKHLEKEFLSFQKSDSLPLNSKDLWKREQSSLSQQFVALQSLSSLGLNPCFELMLGMEKDLEDVRMETIPQLLEYCYQVAGTVGLMMCPVLQIENEKAYPFAVDLGISMQLYNICRDIPEDAKMGRIYLPSELCQRFGMTHQDFIPKEQPDLEKLKSVIQELLSLADQYYESGRQGLVFIPWYARWGIAVAATVYRGIGDALKSQNLNPYVQRAHTSLGLKVLLTCKAFFIFIKTLFPRESENIHHNPSLHHSLRQKPGCRQDGSLSSLDSKRGGI